MSVVEKPAAFVVVRLAGAALALTGATFLGLLLSAAWCLDSEAASATCGLFAGSAILFGMAGSMMAWWPRRALVVVAAGALSSVVAWPFVVRSAEARESARVEQTRRALTELGRAIAADEARGGTVLDRDAPASVAVRDLPGGEDLPVVDGWDRPIQYRRDEEGWWLVARCRCGLPDADEGHSHVGPAVVGPRADMIWREGELEPWPGELPE